MSKLLVKFNKEDKKRALVESIGSFLIVYLSQASLITYNSESDSKNPSVLQQALLQASVISLITFVTMNITGANLNPIISFGTWLTGVSRFKTMLWTVAGQFFGSILAYICLHFTMSYQFDLIMQLGTYGT
jgi:glycerol uptake facilitator-like aquaporin